MAAASSIFFCIGDGWFLRNFKGESVFQDKKTMVQEIYSAIATRTKFLVERLWCVWSALH